MKIVGLIVEYNPFHNGHLHHIEEAFRVTGADKAIAVMSGDFVQRGAPAIMPKHLRTEMALRSGASIVIELPVRYATGSAEFFATGAISLLDQLGCVDSICFGSESGNIEALSTIANILMNEPEAYRTLLQKHLKAGLSYPLARQKAMEFYLSLNGDNPELNTILSEPNNILGIEYLKALSLRKSSMIPYTITRKTSHYHDIELKENCSSASAIRARFKNSHENDLPVIHDLNIKEQVPSHCYATLESNYQKRYPIYSDDFSLLLHAKLLSESKESLMDYDDMTIELANRIINLRYRFISIEQFTHELNSKNITHSRLSRILFHILLHIKKYPNSVENHYIHVLGFRKDDQKLLSIIKENSSLPIMTKLTSLDHLDWKGQSMIIEDIYASNLYETVVTNKFKTNYIHELEKSLVLL